MLQQGSWSIALCLMTLDDAWWHLMTLDDAWWRLMMLYDTLWHFMTLYDAWWRLMWSASIIHLIIKHHAFDLQESCIWSSGIMHLIIKHHAFDHQELCIWSSRIMHLIIKNHAFYNIMNAIASLIATYKRYALVSLYVPLKHLFIHLWRPSKGPKQNEN